MGSYQDPDGRKHREENVDINSLHSLQRKKERKQVKKEETELTVDRKVGGGFELDS